MQRVTPCLWFDGQAEEAATFYVSLMPDSRIESLMRMPTQSPGGPEGPVVGVEFTVGGTRFQGLNGGPQFSPTEAVSFIMPCESQAEVDRLWAALIDGGQPGQCGWLKDRWGFSWQIVPTKLYTLLRDPDTARAGRAMQAMMTMTKIELAELERAADGA